MNQERDSYRNHLIRTIRQAEYLTEQAQNLDPNPRQLSMLDVVNLALLTARTLGPHRSFRRFIKEEDSIPKVVKDDPPSLRSTIWMVIIDKAIQNGEGKDKTQNPEDYPLRLFALTRCFLNGMDDIMDSNTPPIDKSTFAANQRFRTVMHGLSLEFAHLNRQNVNGKETVRKSLRNYRLIRDLWIEYYNDVEQNRESLDFDSALRYTLVTMGPMTYVLTYTLSVNRDLTQEQEDQVNKALFWYAAAGKLIDDMTDWLKDWHKGELNLFTLALKESGELERVIKYAGKLRVFGKKAFVPTSIFQILAPGATQKVLGLIDSYIAKLGECGFHQLTSTMKGVRQAMWAYALNESVPKV